MNNNHKVILASSFLLVALGMYCTWPKKVGRDLTGIYQSVKNRVKKSDEKAIPIVGLYVYPIRGIRSPFSLD